MPKNKPLKSIKKGEEITSLTDEELQNMRFNISIKVPKEEFDELLKAMLDGDNDTTNGKYKSIK